jgi:hypothetical protein
MNVSGRQIFFSSLQRQTLCPQHSFFSRSVIFSLGCFHNPPAPAFSPSPRRLSWKTSVNIPKKKINTARASTHIFFGRRSLVIEHNNITFRSSTAEYRIHNGKSMERNSLARRGQLLSNAKGEGCLIIFFISLSPVLVPLFQ